jgi:hypothetical protein
VAGTANPELKYGEDEIGFNRIREGGYGQLRKAGWRKGTNIAMYSN